MKKRGVLIIILLFVLFVVCCWFQGYRIRQSRKLKHENAVKMAMRTTTTTTIITTTTTTITPEQKAKREKKNLRRQIKIVKDKLIKLSKVNFLEEYVNEPLPEDPTPTWNAPSGAQIYDRKTNTWKDLNPTGGLIPRGKLIGEEIVVLRGKTYYRFTYETGKVEIRSYRWYAKLLKYKRKLKELELQLKEMK